MRKFLFCAKATYQMNHAAVRVFRRVSVLQQKNSGTLIGQVALQCMGTININQGTSSADSERQNSDSFRNQLFIQLGQFFSQVCSGGTGA
ncbi:hypothetical protein BACCAP_01255 [Pseudoflavonifractor capillosus ATCC 29799]|uniref:Uncharacterized protein n=1 Tax=Pseudoflavonifractor capillosus ATCC 29799 TaxID=411467 RepID=A6NSS6_9FIRM|nr:hypothetical protein BACCAP_01255 [Pseudoflavonifractor capillosus ATCC 29799]